ncbi:MAG: hypothetical protein GTN62_09850 [Gemmatimonadales bacterium]|nr:hypothetical protein [Gemmatimonadales bacterium]NIN11848.1 hypothetical protein [Gemmatimonadales bacterium]NIN50398.1 hypothetical protein [Gemmatimonadales bacterium]NIP07862.1 hypothetical protein [Gemmatimonadales bacterium]NIR02067.1 hypothetical protein [Gemmatimonadales bacterium]
MNDNQVVKTRARWPAVIGTIGIILAVLSLIDAFGDLVSPAVWSREELVVLFSTEFLRSLEEMLPPPGWLLFSSIIGWLLGVLLLTGSIFLVRRRQIGVTLCKAWSLVAIPWALVHTGLAYAWFQRIPEGTLQQQVAGWEGVIAVAFIMGAAIAVAFPVFLLIWFARHSVRAAYTAW